MNAKVDPRSEKAWRDFLSEIELAQEELGCNKKSSDAWFRGHTSAAYPLLPSLFRSFEKRDSNKVWKEIWNKEKDLYWEFSARARELHGLIEEDWDILFAMQHYGTPTRLLDWTEVLGVAIYFAILGVDGSKPEPPCVWVLNPYKLNKMSGWGKDLVYPPVLGWDEDEETYYGYGELLMESEIGWECPIAIYPRQRNPRLHAQRAWFTIHGDEYVAMNEVDGSEKYLRPIILPFEAIPSAQKFLKLAGINHYLLFADLESLSLHLQETNSLLDSQQLEAKAKRRLRHKGK